MLCFCKKKREFTLCLMILTTTLKNKKSKYYNFNFSSKETGPERSRVTVVLFPFISSYSISEREPSNSELHK